jgi:hypothetical protein
MDEHLIGAELFSLMNIHNLNTPQNKHSGQETDMAITCSSLSLLSPKE